MEYLAWFVFGFAFLRLLVAFSNLGLTYGAGRKSHTVDGNPLLSVLIPARNEEDKLPLLLESLLSQSYKNMEILIYDDDSTDGTWEVITRYSQQHPSVRGIRGGSLPEGWLGKNHACHQLSLQAGGDYLLFVDADIQLGSRAAGNALAYLQAQHLQLLSLFPTQRMNSWGERITVPLMNWVLLSLLPLRLVSWSRLPALAAANGQFMLFNAKGYRLHQWHQRVRANPVEDILISRLLKKEGYSMACLTGDSEVCCRMYHSWTEGVLGFSKNAVQFVGGSYWMLSLYTLLVLAGPFLVFFYLPMLPFLLFLLLIAGTQLMVSIQGRQNPWRQLLLHPLLMFSWGCIFCLSVQQKMRGQLRWKGRTISIKPG